MSKGGAGDLLEIVEDGDVLPAGEELADGFALAVADFEGDDAAGGEGGVGLGDEAGVDVEAGGSGKEGLEAGFVVADLGLEGFAVGGGDVGWVADDGVEGDGRDRGEQIGFEEVDSVGDAVGFGVLAGYGQGFGGDVGGGYFGMREVDGEGDGEDAGAGAYVGDEEVVVFGEAFEDGFCEELGLGAGDEDGGGDAWKGEAIA